MAFALSACGRGPRDAAELQPIFPEVTSMLCVRGDARVRPFLVDCYEVTNSDYEAFVRESGYRPEDESFLKSWWIDEKQQLRPPAGKQEHPVTWVSYFDAEAFARHNGKRLPTKREWEHAASPAEGAIYPWGTPNFYRYYCNVLATGIGETAPVGMFPGGSTRPNGRGCHDMAGNVWEWIAPDPDDPLDLPSDALAHGGEARSPLARGERRSALDFDIRNRDLAGWPYRLIKGGSFQEAAGDSRDHVDWAQITPYRITEDRERVEVPRTETASERTSDIGFRCVRDLEPFLEHSLQRLEQLPAAESDRGGKELVALGDDFFDILGERDRARRAQFEVRTGSVRTFFPVAAGADAHDLLVLTDAGDLERLRGDGEVRWRVPRARMLPSEDEMLPEAALLSGDRVLVTWRSRSYVSVIKRRVAVTVLAFADGEVLARRIRAGGEIALLPLRTDVLVLIDRELWWAPLVRYWPSFRSAYAEERLWAPLPRWLWGALRAWEKSSTVLQDELESGPETDAEQETELIAMRVEDGAIFSRRVVPGRWTVLALEDGERRLARIPADSWLLSGRRGLARVSMRDRAFVLESLELPERLAGLPLVPVSGDTARGSGNLILAGADAAGGYHLLHAGADGRIDELWTASLADRLRVTGAERVEKGMLLLQGRVGGSGRAHLVSAASGQIVDPVPIGAPCVVSQIGGRAWLSFAEPRGVTLCRADGGGSVRHLRMQTISGPRHVLFDPGGGGEPLLLIEHGNALECFDMREHAAGLDRALRAFWSQ